MKIMAQVMMVALAISTFFLCATPDVHAGRAPLTDLHTLPNVVTLSTLLEDPSDFVFILAGIISLIVVCTALLLFLFGKLLHDLCERRFPRVGVSAIRGAISAALIILGLVLVPIMSNMSGGYISFMLSIVSKVLIVCGIIGTIGAAILFYWERSITSRLGSHEE